MYIQHGNISYEQYLGVGGGGVSLGHLLLVFTCFSEVSFKMASKTNEDN